MLQVARIVFRRDINNTRGRVATHHAKDGVSINDVLYDDLHVLVWKLKDCLQMVIPDFCWLADVPGRL